MRLDRVRDDWTRLGEQDPLWAVLVDPARRHGGWDADEFLATGRAEVDDQLAAVRELGLTPGRASALDFGCGAGRLTQALAQHVDHAVGIDISEPMLARARSLDASARCEFVLNDSTDLRRFDDASFDLVYSSLVLQHLPPELAHGYLAEMARVLRPGGAIVVQVASHPDRSWRGLLTRLLPQGALRFAQQRLLRYPAPMDMYPMTPDDVSRALAVHGARVVDRRTSSMYGGHWVYTRYVATR